MHNPQLLSLIQFLISNFKPKKIWIYEKKNEKFVAMNKIVFNTNWWWSIQRWREWSE